jgi:SAM-dependent methyltransferase
MIVDTAMYLMRMRWYAMQSFMTHIGKPNESHCEICGWQGKYFASFYSSRMVKRVDTLCPKCGSVERTRIVYQHLKRKNSMDMRVMEVGALPKCQLLPLALPEAECFTVDKYHNAEYIMDLTALKFADNSFDVIVALSVLQQIEDDGAALKEIYRVLKKGGETILWVPMDTRNTRPFGVEVGKWYRVYEKETFAKRLQGYGFKTEVINYESRDASAKEGVIFRGIK